MATKVQLFCENTALLWKKNLKLAEIVGKVGKFQRDFGLISICELSNLILRGRTVSLFPDIGATDYWRGKVPMMRQLGIHAQLYDYLERTATDEQRKQGLDIADFLLDIETDEGKLEQMRLTNQSIDKLINQLQLQPVKTAH